MVPNGGPLMFAPSINVDLEKLQQAPEEKPARRKTAARGRPAAARKAAPKPETTEAKGS